MIWQSEVVGRGIGRKDVDCYQCTTRNPLSANQFPFGRHDAAEVSGQRREEAETFVDAAVQVFTRVFREEFHGDIFG